MLLIYSYPVNASGRKKCTHESKDTDSDSDIDAEMVVNSSDDINLYVMDQSKKDILQSTDQSITSSIRNQVAKGEYTKCQNRKKNIAFAIKKKKKSVIEIESGVEITEDMSLNANINLDDISDVSCDAKRNQKEYNFSNQPSVIYPTSNNIQNDNKAVHSLRKQNSVLTSNVMNIRDRIYNNSLTIISTLILFLSWMFALPQFLLGILTCLYSLTLISALYKHFLGYFKINELLNNIENNNNHHGPQRMPFSTPNYSEMDLCKVPAIEEFKPLKSYSVSQIEKILKLFYYFFILNFNYLGMDERN